MDAVELRPLSTGEILDRTFTMYRRHFLFFVTLAGIFQIPSLALSLYQAQLGILNQFSVERITLTLISVCVSVLTTVLAGGGAVLAIAEFYLGHTITIGETIQRVFGRFFALLGAAILTYLAFFFGFIFLFIPGIYILTRLLVMGPVVVIDKKGPGGAFARSWALTQGFAGRSFLIILLYSVLILAMSAVSTVPLTLMIANAANDPERLRWLMSLQVILATIGAILIAPFIHVASAIFYYDLRVRKEAFDLQFMMNPDAPADDPRFLAQ